MSFCATCADVSPLHTRKWHTINQFTNAAVYRDHAEKEGKKTTDTALMSSLGDATLIPDD